MPIDDFCGGNDATVPDVLKLESSPKPGWIGKQFARIERDYKTWPEWMKQETEARMEKTVEIDWKTRAEAAEAQVAALREALASIYDAWENGTPCFEDVEDHDGPLGNAFQLQYEEENRILGLLENTAAAAEAYEARSRRDERRKVYVEERDRLNKLANDYLRARDPGYDKGEDYFELLDQRDYFEEQLAALDAASDGEQPT